MLSLSGRDRSRLLATGKIGSHRVVLADAEDAPDHVIADTFLRFQGLERMCHHHGASPRLEDEFRTRMHIALTRPMVAAIVMCDEDAVRQDNRLRWLIG